MKILLNIRRRLPLIFLAVVLAPLAIRGEWGVVLTALATGIFFGILAYPAQIQANLLRALAPDEPRNTDLAEWPNRDIAGWDETARQWRELGFEPRELKIAGEETPKLGLTLSQLWLAPERDALLEISQTFLAARKFPVTSAVFSYWGDGAALEDRARALVTIIAPIASPLPVAAVAAPRLDQNLPVRTYSTHNRPAHWVYNFFLQPQLMGTRLDGATPQQLWETHLARRASVSQVLGQPPIRSELIALCSAQRRVLRAMWRRQFAQRFTRQFWRARFQSAAPTETWGELDAQIRALSA